MKSSLHVFLFLILIINSIASAIYFLVLACNLSFQNKLSFKSSLNANKLPLIENIGKVSLQKDSDYFITKVVIPKKSDPFFGRIIAN